MIWSLTGISNYSNGTSRWKMKKNFGDLIKSVTVDDIDRPIQGGAV